MPTKITIIYDNPANPAAFEAGWPESLELAKALPGLERLESGKVWPKEDGTATPKYRTLDLYFADYDAASAAVAGPEAGAFFPTVFGLGEAGVTALFTDVESA